MLNHHSRCRFHLGFWHDRYMWELCFRSMIADIDHDHSLQRYFDRYSNCNTQLHNESEWCSFGSHHSVDILYHHNQHQFHPGSWFHRCTWALDNISFSSWRFMSLPFVFTSARVVVAKVGQPVAMWIAVLIHITAWAFWATTVNIYFVLILDTIGARWR